MTRAIMTVHLYGHPCEMDALIEVAERHDVHIVEDAAHALPAVYKGRMAGTIGTATAFSFCAAKNITTAGGGMRQFTADPFGSSLEDMTVDGTLCVTGVGGLSGSHNKAVSSERIKKMNSEQ